MAIDPRGADLERYLQEDPGGPVVMLDLLRFAEGVRFPSREAFSRMVADQEHQQVTHFRTAALTEVLLQPTTAWDRG